MKASIASTSENARFGVFAELMNNVRDDRDNRGRKLKLLELLVNYVFHFLLINERTDKCGYDNENHKEIMQILGVKKITEEFRLGE